MTAGILATLLLLAALSLGASYVVERWRKWPEPVERPWACIPCDLTFTDARQVAWHAAQHATERDDDRWVP